MSRVFLLLTTLVLLVPGPARAAFHLAVIDEVMVGANGNPDVQFVEIRMLAPGQNSVSHTRLFAFNCTGAGGVPLIADLPGDVLMGGSDRRWIMGTDAFATASGIAPDFTFPPGIFTPCGMVCWGAPGQTVPENPPTWPASDPDNYTDCVAYGGYTGARPSFSGNPTTLGPGDGVQSLTRVTSSQDNLTDFALACATPTNNAGQQGGFGGCTPATTTTTTSAGGTTTSSTFPPGEGQRVGGQKLVVKKAVLNALSKDAAITLGDGNQSADDPTVNGGSLRIRSGPAGFDQTFQLPAASWRYLGKQGANKGYKLKPTSPVKTVLLKKGRLKVVVKTSLSALLASSPNPVDLVLVTGSERYCMSFGGAPKYTTNKKYLATGATAPSACPP